MNKLEVLKFLVETFGIPEDKRNAPSFDLLRAPLPEEAKMPPKAGVDGFDKKMVGYKGIYVTMAANDRLGVGGWVEVPIWEKEFDCILPGPKKTPGIGVDVELVTYFPHLHRATFGVGTGQGQDYGDARKAAVTTARKRALADIGIGWDGYTEHTGQAIDPLDIEMQGHGPAKTNQPPLAPPRREERYNPPKPAPAPAQKPASPAREPETFADAANAAADPQAPASDHVEAAFQDVLELLAEDGLVAKTEKGIAWFRARATDFGFFDGGGSGESKVKLIERMNGIHKDRNKKLHARYRAVFGEDEAGRRAWMKQVIGKDSTAACTTQERIRLLAELADLAKERT